jgi:hypothetical protein
MGKGKKMITLREFKEKAVSKQQQKLMGLALAYKRGEVSDNEVSDSVKNMAKSMSEKELEDFAGTKHKGLPDKVDEAKSSSGYDLYHRDFSSAMQHAYKHAKAKLGVDVDPEEIDSKVASGPRKPSKGKTNTYRLLDKGGKKAIQVQVYGMDNGKYELNMYKESVDISEDGHTDVDSSERMCKTVMEDAKEIMEYLDGMDGESSLPTWWTNKLATASKDMNSLRDYLVNPDDNSGKMDEEMDPTKHVSKKGDMYCVYNKDGKEVAKFDNKKDADAYAIKNHDKLMEYVEVGTNAIRNTYAKATPGQTNELTGTDKAIAGAALGALGYGAKKAVDRFNPTKVRDARKKRMERDAEKRQAERDIAQMKRKKLQGSN